MSLIVDIGMKLVEPIIDIFIKPKIEKMYREAYIDDVLIGSEIEEHFRIYLNNSYGIHSNIKTIALGNDSVLLENIYVPLKIKTSTSFSTQYEFLINKYPVELTNMSKYNLILDQAGMGKSTLLKYIFLKAIEEKQGYPIIINLRNIFDNNVMDVILNEINLIHLQIDEAALRQLLNRGDFIILFDGLDEIPLESRSKVYFMLNDFIKKTRNNTIFITSRPDEDVSSLITTFVSFYIAPLSETQAFNIIKRYDFSSDKRLSTNLIKEIQNSDNNVITSIKTFLKNPLLVSILFYSYSFKNILYTEVHFFYQNVFDALYNQHDRFKEGVYEHEKYTNLGQSEFDQLLRLFSYETLPYSQTSYMKEYFETKIRKIQQKKNIQIIKDNAINLLLKDLVTSISLFLYEDMSYKWCHKSMQEFFFAKYILWDCIDRDDTLKKIYKSDKFHIYENMLYIYNSLNRKSFEDSIVYYFIKDIIDEYFYNSNLCDSNLCIILALYDIALIVEYNDIKVRFIDKGNRLTIFKIMSQTNNYKEMLYCENIERLYMPELSLIASNNLHFNTTALYEFFKSKFPIGKISFNDGLKNERKALEIISQSIIVPYHIDFFLLKKFHENIAHRKEFDTDDIEL